MPDHQKTKTSASPCLGEVTSGCAARSLTGRRQRTPDQRLARAFIRPETLGVEITGAEEGVQSQIVNLRLVFGAL